MRLNKRLTAICQANDINVEKLYRSRAFPPLFLRGRGLTIGDIKAELRPMANRGELDNIGIRVPDRSGRSLSRPLPALRRSRSSPGYSLFEPFFRFLLTWIAAHLHEFDFSLPLRIFSIRIGSPAAIRSHASAKVRIPHVVQHTIMLCRTDGKRSRRGDSLRVDRPKNPADGRSYRRSDQLGTDG